MKVLEESIAQKNLYITDQISLHELINKLQEFINSKFYPIYKKSIQRYNYILSAIEIKDAKNITKHQNSPITIEMLPNIRSDTCTNRSIYIILKPKILKDLIIDVILYDYRTVNIEYVSEVIQKVYNNLNLTFTEVPKCNQFYEYNIMHQFRLTSQQKYCLRSNQIIEYLQRYQELYKYLDYFHFLFTKDETYLPGHISCKLKLDKKFYNEFEATCFALNEIIEGKIEDRQLDYIELDAIIKNTSLNQLNNLFKTKSEIFEYPLHPGTVITFLKYTVTKNTKEIVYTIWNKTKFADILIEELYKSLIKCT